MHASRFTAPWARSLILVSIIATVTLVTVAAWSTRTAKLRMPGGVPVPAAVVIGLLAGASLYTVRGYEVTDDAVLVQRLFWVTRLPRRSLISATLEPNAFTGTVRTCGNGGLYSISGWYWNKRIGTFRALVTDPKRTVVLRFSDRKPVVVSPGDPEGFIRALFP